MINMYIIIVTGTPGTGKTRIAKSLSKLFNYVYIGVNKIINKNKNIVVGYDRKRKSKIVDEKKLSKLLIEYIKEKKEGVNGIVIDSHLSHYLPRRYVDLCIVTKCSNLKLLERRLKRRGYSKEKVRENLDSEIFQICYVEAKEAGHNVIVVDTC